MTLDSACYLDFSIYYLNPIGSSKNQIQIPDFFSTLIHEVQLQFLMNRVSLNFSF